MQSERKHSIESIIKLFSFIYVLLITCGLTYNYFFYKGFGINITEFIDISEVLIQFIPLLADVLVIMLLFLLVINFLTKSLLFEETSDISKTIERKKMRKTWVILFFCSIGLAIIFYLLCLFVYSSYRLFYMWLLISIVFFVPIILEMVFNFFNKEMNINLPTIFRDVAYTFIIFISITIWASYSKVEKMRRNGNYKKFELVFKADNARFISDSTKLYLGRTKSYLFIHDSKERKSHVINVSDIKEFIITN